MEDITEKWVPISIEAEQGLLGAILINNNALNYVADVLTPDHFGEPLHGLIFEVSQKLIGAGKLASPMTLKQFIPDQMILEGMTTNRYLARLAAEATTIINARDYAITIRDLAKRRELNLLADRIREPTPHDVLDLASTAIEEIDAIVGELSHSTTRGVSASGMMASAVDAAARAYQAEGRILGLPSGLTKLDRKLLGFTKGELIIVAGRPGMGKSALMVTASRNMAERGHRGILFSQEMSEVALGQRMIADWLFDRGPINYFNFRSGRFDEAAFGRVRDAAEAISLLPLRTEPQPAQTMSQIAAKARQAKRREGLDFVMVDHLQIMATSGKYQSRNDQIGEITAGAKALAKELDIAVFLLCQLSRAVESRDNKRPMMADLRDCLTGEALVTNADTGQRVAVAEIVKGDLRFNVWGVGENLKLAKKPISKSWAVSKKPIFRISTRSGRSLRCSAGHKFKTVHGWRELADLRVGSFVATPRVQPSPTSDHPEISADKALLLGWLLGDGFLGGSACLTVATREEAEIAAILAHKEFGIHPVIKPERANTAALRVVMTTGRMSGAKKNPMTRWLRSLGVWKVTSKDKFIPATIFSQPNDVVAAFLRGLFHADGSLSCRKSSALLRLSTISPHLADGTRHLLLRFGLNAIVNRDTRNIGGFRTSTKALYTVALAQLPAVDSFMRTIGFLGEKHSKAINALGGRTFSDISQFDRIPLEINERVSGLRLDRGLSHAGLGWREQGKAMSRTTARILGERLQDDLLLSLGMSDILWDAITSIEPDGEEMTYDLTVGDVHSFSVNDIFTHNSGNIEQDADVIIMLYREMYYLERRVPPSGTAEHAVWQTACFRAQNKLELLVEKQRAGPTGTVEVFCNIGCNAVRNLDENEIIPTAALISEDDARFL